MKVNTTYRHVLWPVILLVVLWGCAGGKPFDPPEPGEIPEGPGIFTKEEGTAVLYDSKKAKAEPTAADAVPRQTTADESKPPSAATFEEYEEYRKWLEWKKSAGDSNDYKEFQEWREWRQYQKWKKGQQ